MFSSRELFLGQRVESNFQSPVNNKSVVAALWPPINDWKFISYCIGDKVSYFRWEKLAWRGSPLLVLGGANVRAAKYGFEDIFFFFNYPLNQWLPATLTFNNPCIQAFLDSTTLRFNNLEFNNLGLNNPWMQQSWGQQHLDSKILDSTTLGFNNRDFDNSWIQQSWIQQPSHSAILGFNNTWF